MHVLLTDGTVGVIVGGLPVVGESVCIMLHDENGNRIMKYGIVDAVL
jgi:hypothetical protein